MPGLPLLHVGVPLQREDLQLEGARST
jgi:hypothetical protein